MDTEADPEHPLGFDEEVPQDQIGRGLVDNLIQATLNEKNSPEILQHQTAIVDELQSQIRKQEAVLENIERYPEQELRRIAYNLELRRIRYLLKLYLRTRLHKLEAYAVNILGDNSMHAKLSKHEQDFTQDYVMAVGCHLRTSFLDHLPDEFASVVKTNVNVERNDLVAEPVRDAHVFCSILEDASDVQLGEDQVIDMKQGDLFIVRYESIARLVQEGKAVLV